MIFQPDDASSGLWVVRALPGSSGCKMGPHAGQDAPTIGPPTHMPTLSSSGHGGKPEHLEKTHADWGHMATPHTEGPRLGIDFFSSMLYENVE